jgi:hypothetical protein
MNTRMYIKLRHCLRHVVAGATASTAMLHNVQQLPPEALCKHAAGLPGFVQQQQVMALSATCGGQGRRRNVNSCAAWICSSGSAAWQDEALASMLGTACNINGTVQYA